MPPQLADNDNSHDLRAWLATIPSFAADWPRGIISSTRAATTPAAPPAPGLSAGGLSFGNYIDDHL